MIRRYTRTVNSWRLRVVSPVLVATLGGLPAADAVCGLWCDIASLRVTSAAGTDADAHSSQHYHHGEANADADAVAESAREHHHHSQSVETVSTIGDAAQSVVVAADCCRFGLDAPLRAIVNGRSDDVVSIDRSNAVVPLDIAGALQAQAGQASGNRDTVPPGHSRPSQLSTILRI